MKRVEPRGASAWAKALGATVAGAVSALAFGAGQAFAQAAPVEGRPVDTAIDLQAPATDIAHQIHDFHTFVLIIITAITALVLALLLWIIVRYNKKSNPVPKKFTHNMLVEVLWTVVPVIILVLIAVKSFPILSQEEHVPRADLVIKATGNSWYWSYDYPDQGVTFDANVLSKEDAAAAGTPYLLSTDETVVVPTGKVVQMLISSNDVIHSWTVPSFGIKQDAIPGRVNTGWFKVEKPGLYFGQCSELCGIRHAFMPIQVKAVTPEEFDAWIASKGGKLAATTTAPAAPATPAGEPAAPAAPAAAPAGNPAR